MWMSIIVIVLVTLSVGRVAVQMSSLANPAVTIGPVIRVIRVHQPFAPVAMVIHVGQNEIAVEIDVAHVSCTVRRLVVGSDDDGASGLRVGLVATATATAIVRAGHKVQVRFHVGVGRCQSASGHRVRFGPLHALDLVLVNVRNEADTRGNYFDAGATEQAVLVFDKLAPKAQIGSNERTSGFDERVSVFQAHVLILHQVG